VAQAENESMADATALEELITGQEIAAWLKCSYSYFRDKISKQYKFPKPIRRGLWRKRDINNWVCRWLHTCDL